MKSINLIAIVAMLLWSCQENNTTQQARSPYDNFQNGIRWEGENEIANYLAMQGINHYMNVEREKAYVLFEKAVELDSSLFACHTALALMSKGEKRGTHKAMAKKYVANENETSKLFVSLLDIAIDSTGADQRREVWRKMHEISNGPFIHFRYATSLDDNLETIKELDKLKVMLDSLGMNTAYISNIKGYLYQILGDLDKGTAEIDQYLAQYPDGYNPLDSRAEFYLFAGDTTTAIEFYEKTLEKFPFTVSAQNALDDLSK